MKMSHVTLYTLTSPLLTVLPQPLSVHHLRSPMYMVLNVIISLRIPWKTLLFREGLPTGYLVTEAKLLSLTHRRISYEHSALTNGKVNHTSTTRILRNDATRPLRTLLIASLIVLVHLHTYGYCAYNMFATYLIIHIT
jgi:hypothetical protein